MKPIRIAAAVMAAVMMTSTIPAATFAESEGFTGVFEQSEPDELVLKVNYYRPDKNYSDWDVYIWNDGGYTDSGEFYWYEDSDFVTATFVVPDLCDYGFIVRMGGDSWLGKDVEYDRFVTQDLFVNAKAEIWLISGDYYVYTSNPLESTIGDTTAPDEDNSSEDSSEEEVIGDSDNPVVSEYDYYIDDDGTIEIRDYYGSAKNLVIPAEIDGYKVKGIGMRAFEDCTSLTSVVVSEGIQYIESPAFYGCTSLKSISIPASLLDLEDALAFDGCYSLTDITVDSNNKYYKSADGVVFTKDGEELLFCAQGKSGKYSIPDNVKIIADMAFQNCKYITEINIPVSVTTIGHLFVASCSSLNSVTLLKSVTNIAEFAFAFQSGDFVIYCYKDSCAEKHAKEFGINYKLLAECEKHVYTEYISETPATCTTDGEVKYLCTVCGGIITEVIPATGHTWGEWTVITPATCTEDGKQQHKCEVCGEIETVAIKATGHTYSTEWTTDVEPTCTEPGSKSHHCVICDAKTDITEIPAKGHTFTDKVVPPTYTEKGYTLHKCSVCGYSYKDKYTDKLVLAKVKGFKVKSRTDTSITLSWNKNSEATGYIIEQYKGNKWVRIAKIQRNATTSCKVSSLAGGSRYVFRIQAYKEIGSGAVKSEYTAKLEAYTNPKAVTGFKVSKKTASTITLTWKNNSTADGYIIEQYKNGKWVRIAKLEGNGKAVHKVTGLSAVTRYVFRIQCYKIVGDNALKSTYTKKLEVYTNPKNMTGFKAGSKTDKSFVLKWDKNSTATGYIIEQYKGNKWVRIAKLGKNSVTSCKISGVSPSTRYAFRIRAYKEIGSGAVKSEYSKKLVVYTNPKKVTSFKASAKTKNSITLKWDKNNTATGYIIEQYKGNKWVRIAKVTSNSTTSVKITGLKKNTRYVFRIQAYKDISDGGAVKSAYTDKLVVYTKK